MFEGIGGVLFQRDEEGQEYVISYASQVLTDAERNYDTTNHKMLAIYN